MIVLNSPKDAKSLKTGDQFTIEVDDMDPRLPDESDGDFERRSEKARAEMEAIFAAVDEAMADFNATQDADVILASEEECARCVDFVETALRNETLEDAVKSLRKADFIAYAKMKGIDHRGREAEIAARIKDALE